LSLLLPPPPRSPLFPYTTLFRSPPMAPAPQTRIRIFVSSLPALRHYPRSRPAARGFPRRLPARGRACPRRSVDRGRRSCRRRGRSEEHTSELQSLAYLVCRLLLE